MESQLHHPINQEIARQKIVLLAEQGDTRAALKEIDQALQAGPSSELLLMKAKVLARNGQWDEAREVLGGVSEGEPGWEEAQRIKDRIGFLEKEEASTTKGDRRRALSSILPLGILLVTSLVFAILFLQERKEAAANRTLQLRVETIQRKIESLERLIQSQEEAEVKARVDNRNDLTEQVDRLASSTDLLFRSQNRTIQKLGDQTDSLNRQILLLHQKINDLQRLVQEENRK